MPLDIQNRSWPAINLTRSYPCTDWATRQDVTESFTLPDDFLAELYFPVAADQAVSPANFFIQQLAIYATGLSLSLGYNSTSGAITVATMTVGRASFTPFMTLALPGQGAFISSIGKVVLGYLDGLDIQGAGHYWFSPAATQLDVDCIRPQLMGVSSIQIVDNNGPGKPLYGALQLGFGTNGQLTASDQTIQISAIQGVGLNETCECSGLPATATPITSLNGLTSSTGAFTIVGDSCMQVSSLANGLKVSDSCSSPCCGCPEQQTLQNSINYILQQIRTMQDFQSRIQTEVARMNSVVIASKVNDSGCVTCS